MSKTYYPVYKSSSGDVGVGTTSPTLQSNYRFLQVNGSVSAVIETTVGGTRIGGFDSTSSVLYVGTIGSYPVVFRTAVDEKMRISTNGNVGIGTSSPAYKLDVTGEMRQSGNNFWFSGARMASDGSGNIDINYNNGSSPSFTWYNGGTSALTRITPTGDILIGTTTSPSHAGISLGTTGTVRQLLGGMVNTSWRIRERDVIDAVAITTNINDSGTQDSAARSSWKLRMGWGNGQDNVVIARSPAGSNSFSDLFYIKSDGNVGIGTTSPSIKLAVDGEASFGDGSKLTMIGLDINSQSTPSFIKIRTKIPFASGTADFTINIKGFRYNSAETTNLMICWHYYNSTFYNPALTSSGSFAPIVKLSAEDWDSSGTPKVCIVLVSPGYWPKLYVESMYSSSYNDAYADGWDWVDADATGTGNNLATLSYKSNFGNNFVMLANGNVGIGSTGPNYKLDVNGIIGLGSGVAFAEWNGNYNRIYEPGGNIAILLGNANDQTNYYNNTSHYFRNRAGNSIYGVINSNGNLGIGTTSPAAKLVVIGETQISSNSAYTTHLNYQDSGVNFISMANNGYTDFRGSSNNITTMRVKGDGNVGIGTTTVRSTLHVNGDIIRDTNVPYSWSTSAPFRTFSGAYSYANGGVNGVARYLLLWPQITNVNGQNGRFVNARLVVSRGATHAFNDTTIGDIVASAGYNSSANLYSYTPIIGTQLYFYNIVYNSVTYLAISLPISDYRWELTGHFGIEETAYSSPTFVYANTSGVGTVTQLTDYTNESVAIYNKGGNIGIGTTSPFGTAANRTVLSVNGTTDVSLNIGSGGSQRAYLYGVSSYAELGTIGSLPLTFAPNNTEKMRLNVDGNLGIGTTSPGYKLEMTGTSTAIRVLSTTGDAYIRLTDNGVRNWDLKVVDVNDYFEVGGTTSTSLVVTGAGNVGIGTTSPVTKLHVEQVQNAESLITLRNNRQDLADVPIFGISAQNNVTDVAKISFYRGGGGNSGYLTFSTKFDNAASLTEKVRIDGAGNVGIGTTSPSTKLEVVEGEIKAGRINSASEGGQVSFGRSSDNTTAWYIDLYGSGSVPDFRVVDGTIGSVRFNINNNGNVGIGSTSPSQKLDVNGTVKATSYLGDFKGRLVRTSTTQTITGNVALTIDVSAAYIHIITVQASGGTFGITGITYNNRKTEPEVDEIILIFKWPATGSGVINVSNIIGDTPAFNYGKATAVRLTSYKGTGGLWICEQIASNMDYTNL